MANNLVHLDMNAFFAQCEENRNPSLKGHPMAVGTDHKRGIISTANYEARKFGVHSAMPAYQAKRLCPSLIIVPGDYGLYSSVSHRFMAFFRKYFPLVEPVSIDECYIDVTSFTDDAHAHDFLLDFQLKVYSELSLKCSIGYAHTRFLAKMASDYKKPMGLTLVLNDDYKRLFWPLSIDKMWGIGKKTAPRLKEMGILTIGDLANTSSEEVKGLLGSGFEVFQGWANGQGNDQVDVSDWDRKSISTSSTLEEDSDDPGVLKDLLRALSKDVSDELTYEKKKASTIVVTIRDEDFKTRSKRANVGRKIDSKEDIYLEALRIFLAMYKGEKVRLLGVGAEDPSFEVKTAQTNLFEQVETREEKKEGQEEILKKLNEGEQEGLFTTLSQLKKRGNGNEGK